MSKAASHRGGNGTPLVLIHGFSDTWQGWRAVLPALKEHHDVLAVTLAGHFEGAPLPDGVDVSVSALVDAVERDMDAAGFETAHIVGNSLGGWTAIELGARGRARSVTALAPAGGWERDPKIERRLTRLFKRNHRAAKLVAPYADRFFLRPGVRKLAMREVAVHGDRVPPDLAAHMLRGAVGCDIYFALLDSAMTAGFATELAAIDCPVRIAWSEHDRILPMKGYTERFTRLVPNADTIVLPGVGHAPHHDDPELVVRTILEVTEPVDAAAAATEPAETPAPAEA
jgi:pimeloyl-ACP methyl ester carboxylesterase